MGQTNVLGRYPMHFHILGNGCAGCYFKRSSVHRSFYRCVSVHGSHNTTVSENVAYDVIGFCCYLEDGVEEDNTLSFDLEWSTSTFSAFLLMEAGKPRSSITRAKI